jgi:hypothetical protein
MEKITTRPNTINLVVSKLEDILNKILPIFKENSLQTVWTPSLFFYKKKRGGGAEKYFNCFSKVCYLMNNKEHLTCKGYYNSIH